MHPGKACRGPSSAWGRRQHSDAEVWQTATLGCPQSRGPCHLRAAGSPGRGARGVPWPGGRRLRCAPTGPQTPSACPVLPRAALSLHEPAGATLSPEETGDRFSGLCPPLPFCECLSAGWGPRCGAVPTFAFAPTHQFPGTSPCGFCVRLYIRMTRRRVLGSVPLSSPGQHWVHCCKLAHLHFLFPQTSA